LKLVYFPPTKKQIKKVFPFFPPSIFLSSKKRKKKEENTEKRDKEKDGKFKR